jgi:hypothetical protein
LLKLHEQGFAQSLPSRSANRGAGIKRKTYAKIVFENTLQNSKSETIIRNRDQVSARKEANAS